MCWRRGGGGRKGPRWLQGHYLRLPFSPFTVSLTFLGCCFPPFSFHFHDVILLCFGYSLELNFARGFCLIIFHMYIFSWLIRIFILYPAFVTVSFPFHHFFFKLVFRLFLLQFLSSTFLKLFFYLFLSNYLFR